MSSVDVAHFKEVLGHYATGLVIVTADTEQGPAGFTCQTFGSLSLEPPMVVFAANVEGNSWGKVRQGAAVGINILNAEQESLARQFATSGVDKFEGTAWKKGPSGAPLLEAALGHIEGHIAEVSRHGDHELVVLEVSYVHARSGHPLIYFRGGFSELA